MTDTRIGGPPPMWTWVMGSIGFALMPTVLVTAGRQSTPDPALTGTEESESISKAKRTTTGAEAQ